MTKIEAILILNAVPGLGPVSIKQLIDYYGSAATVLLKCAAQLRQDTGLSYKLCESITLFKQDEFLRDELKLIKQHDVQLMSYQDHDYPVGLKEIAASPVILYLKGERETFNSPAISIVGSRGASCYGMNIAEKLAFELAQLNITVVSGLARGIDTAAHRGALKAKGKTIAVLGSGLADIYPRDNKGLSLKILASGLVISEFPMMMPPIAKNFPRRNRIVSALSSGAVVVEATKRSGALITANYALEQGREVFAVPGNIDNPYAFGSNKLIKDGAKLVASVDDILEEIKFSVSWPDEKTHTEETHKCDLKEYDLSNLEEKLINNLNNDPIHVDDLSLKCGVSVVEILPALLKLEMLKLIEPFPGKLFGKAHPLTMHQ